MKAYLEVPSARIVATTVAILLIAPAALAGQEDAAGLGWQDSMRVYTAVFEYVADFFPSGPTVLALTHSTPSPEVRSEILLEARRTLGDDLSLGNREENVLCERGQAGCTLKPGVDNIIEILYLGLIAADRVIVTVGLSRRERVEGRQESAEHRVRVLEMELGEEGDWVVVGVVREEIT